MTLADMRGCDSVAVSYDKDMSTTSMDCSVAAADKIQVLIGCDVMAVVHL